MSRPEIIRKIEIDDRLRHNLLAWRYGYITYETLLEIALMLWFEDRVYQGFAKAAVEDAEKMIGGE